MMCVIMSDSSYIIIYSALLLSCTPQIVSVKRGRARTVLVPTGVAVYGTLWENIDRFADPLKVKAAVQESADAAAAGEEHPLDWINSY